VLYHEVTRRLLAQLNVDLERLSRDRALALIERQHRLGLAPREAAVVIAAVLHQEFFYHICDPRPRAEQSRAVVRVLGTLRRWCDAGRISPDLHRWATDTIEEALTVFSSPEAVETPADRTS
jgi:hypothetical protein